MIEALRRELGASLRTGAEVAAIAQAEDGARYDVTLRSGERLPADLLIVAVPAFVAAELLQGVLPEATDDLAAIPYAGVRVLGLGYARENVPHPLDGFGFLVPRGEGVRMLGCLWTSSLYPWQAPEGTALFRIIAGGVPDPDFVELDDHEALAAVREDLRRTLGIVAEPDMVHHVRWERVIPQYVQGHTERVQRVMRAAAERPGLLLTGNAYHGIGVNDCVRDAGRVAREAQGRLIGG